MPSTLKQQLSSILDCIRLKNNTVLIIGKARTSTYNWAKEYFINSSILKTNLATRESRSLDVIIDKGTGNNKKIFDELWIRVKSNGYYVIKNWSKANNQSTMNLVGHIVSKKKQYGIKEMFVIDERYSLAVFKKL